MEIALEYEHYLSIYRQQLTGDEDQDAPWHYRAQRLHALRVNDALVEVMGAAIILGQSYRGRDATNHLTHGIGRRLKFIWLSVRSLLAISPPDRTQPMNSDDVEIVARDLNVIYINIRGALDNLAAALPSIFGFTGTVSPMNVDLFKPAYLRRIGAQEIDPLLDNFRHWATDLAARRNPAAHRIPLSVPPQILNPATRVEYETALNIASKAQAAAFAACRPGHYPEREFAVARAAHKATERIGVYSPVFVHHPDEGVQAIYPLVTTDVGNLLAISKLVIAHLKQ